MPIYAEAGVPEYWIIDITDDDELVIDVHTEPTATGYATITRRTDGVLRAVAIPLELAIADFPR